MIKIEAIRMGENKLSGSVIAGLLPMLEGELP